MNSSSAARHPLRSASVRRIALAGAAVALVLAAVAGGRRAAALLPALAAWVEGLGVWGPLAFIAVYAIATVALVPGSILTVTAGLLFGLGQGTVFVFFGATLGAVAAFLLGRYGVRRAAEKRLRSRPSFARIDRAIGQEGLKIAFLLRLSPIFPFVLINYALGLTSIRLRHYVLASFGMLPATFLYVYYGKALGTVAAVVGGVEVERGPGYWIVLAAGLAATVAVTAIVTRIARSALAEEVEDG